jgi:hypothetical protein
MSFYLVGGYLRETAKLVKNLRPETTTGKGTSENGVSPLNSPNFDWTDNDKPMDFGSFSPKFPDKPLHPPFIDDLPSYKLPFRSDICSFSWNSHHPPRFFGGEFVHSKRPAHAAQ